MILAGMTNTNDILRMVLKRNKIRNDTYANDLSWNDLNKKLAGMTNQITLAGITLIRMILEGMTLWWHMKLVVTHSKMTFVGMTVRRMF